MSERMVWAWFGGSASGLRMCLCPHLPSLPSSTGGVDDSGHMLRIRWAVQAAQRLAGTVSNYASKPAAGLAAGRGSARRLRRQHRIIRCFTPLVSLWDWTEDVFRCDAMRLCYT